MITEKYFIDDIKNLSIDSNTYKKLLEVYTLYECIQLGGEVDPGCLIDDLLKTLFAGAFNDFNIPVSFLNTPVGYVLFTVKYGCKTNNSFTAIEVAHLVNKTKSLISYDVKNDKIIYSRHGKGKSILINETNLIKYMEDKGFSQDEAIERINLFLKLRNQEKLSLDEISKIINQET
ncbi:hypothetical protein [Clostridium hydrogeniformans]|uniref:hypothetical protein n=1 Tax=Clostridium hydrogeniformans TaxID=349933 RepID=UPI0004819D69|nr:hypothetical protein [Clostridium hydrogeniformans]